MRYTEKDKQRLLDSVIIDENGCWIARSVDSGGYGRISLTFGRTYAHRAAFELFVRRLDKGECACHDCPGGDNPSCCNPDHLFAGTHADNLRDAARKGMVCHGDDHWTRKVNKDPRTVSRDLIHRARRLFESLDGPKLDRCRIVAEELGLSYRTAYRIITHTGYYSKEV